MTNSAMQKLTLATILVLAVLPGAWTEDTALPLGHLAVKEVDGGQLQVEARCVETRLVLEEIAKHTGAPVVFDTPCRTYVSQLNAKRTTTPEKWMDFIASSGAELFCRMKDGAWHVYSLSSSPAYAPAPTEEEIRTRFKSNVLSTPPETGGVTTGLVFIKGKMIPPPYQVTCATNADQSADVQINGVAVKHYSQSASSSNAQVYALPPDGQLTDVSQLVGYLASNLYPRLLQDATQEEAMAQVMQFLAKQSIVERSEVLRIDNTPYNITAWIRMPGISTPISCAVLPTNYDVKTGKFFDMAEGRKTSEEQAKEAQKMILAELARDSVVFYGRTVEVSFCHHPPIALFAAALEKSRGLPLLQAECLVSEVIEDRTLARELAANLDDAALSNVQAILSRKKAAN